MEKEQYTNGEAVDILDNEGMSYAVMDYCDGSYFKDPETAKLWDAAGKALEDLRQYLRKETGRDDI